MRNLLVVAAILLALALPVRGAESTKAVFMQYPDIQGGRIVFCYNNDIYTVPEEGGAAMRLTSHIGEEYLPKLSPDGVSVAFTGQYYGGDNVFVLPTAGGEAKQLTYYPETNLTIDWSPDGARVVYASTRKSHSSFFTRFFTVGANGKGNALLPIDKGSVGAYSPDGKKFLFIRNSARFWWWKRYKGSANADLWLCDLASGAFTKLTDYPGNDMWPMWGHDGWYFVSDRDGVANIYRMDFATREVTRVTEQGADGVSWPSVDFEGKKMVFLNDGRLFRLDLVTRKVSEVEVTLQADPHVDMVEYITPKLDSRQLDISPSGRRVVASVRGHIVSLPAREGVVRVHTKSSLHREQMPLWSPDGGSLAFVSDRDGDQEVYLMDQKGAAPPVRLTDCGGFKEGIQWAPDGRSILYATLDQKLCIVDIATKKSVTIDTSDVDVFGDADFSPDSAWIAYVRYQRNESSQLVLYNTATQQKRALALDEGVYANPAFTKDGKGLLFFKGRFGSVETGYLSLAKAKAPVIRREDDEETGKKEEPAKKKDGAEAKEAPVTVAIDFDGLEARVEYIKEMKGGIERMKTAKGYAYFIKRRYDDRDGGAMDVSLHFYSFKDREVKKVADKVENYELAAFGEKALIAMKGGLRIIKVGATATPPKADGKEDEELVPVESLRLRIDRREEWRQIFEESWRMVKYNFYDTSFHGVDWEQVGAYYRKFLPFVKSRQELNVLLQRMVGELNASHQGAGGGDFFGDCYTAPRYSVGLLGAELVGDAQSRLFRFEKIFRTDDQKEEPAPLDQFYFDVKPGDYLLAINGEKVTLDDNPYSLLWRNGRGRLTVTYNSAPSFAGAKEVNVDPISSERDLRYREWVNGNTKLVDTLSEGKVGYMHLRDMMFLGLREFNAKFREYRYKDALLIDVRYNGGGAIDPLLIDALERQKYMTVRERYGFLLERPENGFYGPMAVLCNEYSYSDAEVFPRAFQIRKLGKVIGTPTLGFVIAVRGHELIDGGYIRNTRTGLWDNEGGMLESKGVQPDIVVENSPEDEMKGEDRQLVTAVEHLLNCIKEAPGTRDYPVPVAPR